MAKPIIFTLDDEDDVLSAINRDLRTRYASDYRIMKSNAGEEALQVLVELRKRGSTVALFLVDQRMPGMTGTQFLSQALEQFPEARKVLLTAYADTQAAIDAINEVRLDHYLLKPWDPPDQNLYPILDTQLAEWHTVSKPVYDGIRIAGAMWSPASHSVKDLLARNYIPYRFLDVDRDSEIRALVEEFNNGELIVPTIFFPDGSVLVDPDIPTLASKVGLQTQPTNRFYDVVIIGGGPAGLGAAVYGTTEGLHVLMVEREAFGGQASFSAKIDNYLGFPAGISGADLTRRAITQAQRFGTEMLIPQEVSHIEVRDPLKIVHLASGESVACHAVVIATGAGYRQLEIPGFEKLTGAGVYYGAATTEATYYKDRPIIVVGGANSAGQGAVFLTRYASKVYMIVRRNELKAADYLKRTLMTHPGIEILYETDIIGVRGEEQLEEVILQNVATGEEYTMECPAVFIFIGVAPRTEFIADLVMRDDRGFVLTGPDLLIDGKRPPGWPLDRDPFLLESSVPGIFVAGDARHGTKHRVAASVGDGGVAISMVHEYLKTV